MWRNGDKPNLYISIYHILYRYFEWIGIINKYQKLNSLFSTKIIWYLSDIKLSYMLIEGLQSRRILQES